MEKISRGSYGTIFTREYALCKKENAHYIMAAKFLLVRREILVEKVFFASLL